jgi:SAM-dependent methyltransferase
MARGPLAGAGGLYEADLVADALLGAGARIDDVRTGLDFGCSSGRVVRVLAAALPDTHWMACDPNERAIAWAREHLPGIDFSVSGDEPPLAIDAAALDLAFAISIWSHFEPTLGLRWLEEMHRLIRPGGHLVLTTHGLTSVGYYATLGLRTPEQSSEIADALYRRGWWYAPEFGAEGDWGVVNPAWGTAFLSPEWVLAELCPRWRVLEFAPGRNAWNQDVYVLQRP